MDLLNKIKESDSLKAEFRKSYRKKHKVELLKSCIKEKEKSATSFDEFNGSKVHINERHKHSSEKLSATKYSSRNVNKVPPVLTKPKDKRYYSSAANNLSAVKSDNLYKHPQRKIGRAQSHVSCVGDNMKKKGLIQGKLKEHDSCYFGHQLQTRRQKSNLKRHFVTEKPEPGESITSIKQFYNNNDDKHFSSNKLDRSNIDDNHNYLSQRGDSIYQNRSCKLSQGKIFNSDNEYNLKNEESIISLKKRLDYPQNVQMTRTNFNPEQRVYPVEQNFMNDNRIPLQTFHQEQPERLKEENVYFYRAPLETTQKMSSYQSQPLLPSEMSPYTETINRIKSSNEMTSDYLGSSPHQMKNNNYNFHNRISTIQSMMEQPTSDGSTDKSAMMLHEQSNAIVKNTHKQVGKMYQSNIYGQQQRKSLVQKTHTNKNLHALPYLQGQQNPDYQNSIKNTNDDNINSNIKHYLYQDVSPQSKRSNEEQNYIPVPQTNSYQTSPNYYYPLNNVNSNINNLNKENVLNYSSQNMCYNRNKYGQNSIIEDGEHLQNNNYLYSDCQPLMPSYSNECNTEAFMNRSQTQSESIMTYTNQENFALETVPVTAQYQQTEFNNSNQYKLSQHQQQQLQQQQQQQQLQQQQQQQQLQQQQQQQLQQQKLQQQKLQQQQQQQQQKLQLQQQQKLQLQQQQQQQQQQLQQQQQQKLQQQQQLQLQQQQQQQLQLQQQQQQQLQLQQQQQQQQQQQLQQQQQQQQQQLQQQKQQSQHTSRYNQHQHHQGHQEEMMYPNLQNQQQCFIDNNTFKTQLHNKNSLSHSHSREQSPEQEIGHQIKNTAIVHRQSPEYEKETNEQELTQSTGSQINDNNMNIVSNYDSNNNKINNDNNINIMNQNESSVSQVMRQSPQHTVTSFSSSHPTRQSPNRTILSQSTTSHSSQNTKAKNSSSLESQSPLNTVIAESRSLVPQSSPKTVIVKPPPPPVPQSSPKTVIVKPPPPPVPQSSMNTVTSSPQSPDKVIVKPPPQPQLPVPQSSMNTVMSSPLSPDTVIVKPQSPVPQSSVNTVSSPRSPDTVIVKPSSPVPQSAMSSLLSPDTAVAPPQSFSQQSTQSMLISSSASSVTTQSQPCRTISSSLSSMQQSTPCNVSSPHISTLRSPSCTTISPQSQETRPLSCTKSSASNAPPSSESSSIPPAEPTPNERTFCKEKDIRSGPNYTKIIIQETNSFSNQKKYIEFPLIKNEQGLQPYLQPAKNSPYLQVIYGPNKDGEGKFIEKNVNTDLLNIQQQQQQKQEVHQNQQEVKQKHQQLQEQPKKKSSVCDCSRRLSPNIKNQINKMIQQNLKSTMPSPEFYVENTPNESSNVHTIKVIKTNDAGKNNRNNTKSSSSNNNNNNNNNNFKGKVLPDLPPVAKIRISFPKGRTSFKQEKEVNKPKLHIISNSNNKNNGFHKVIPNFNTMNKSTPQSSFSKPTINHPQMMSNNGGAGMQQPKDCIILCDQKGYYRHFGYLLLNAATAAVMVGIEL